MFSVAGFSVIVTGGTKGIGKGIARVFVLSGANVLVSGRDEKGGLNTCADLNALGKGRCSFFQGDVSSLADCKRMAEMACTLYGGIQVLCCNAGVIPTHKISEMTEENIGSTFDINIKGTFKEHTTLIISSLIFFLSIIITILIFIYFLLLFIIYK